MASTLTVSLKSNPFPYGFVALATAALIQVIYKDTAELDLVLSKDGAEIKDATQIAQTLADATTSYATSEQFTNVLVKALELRTLTAFKDAVSTFDYLDDILAYHTFLATRDVAAPDLATWGAIKGSSPAQGILKRGQHPHVARWFAHVESLQVPQQVLASVIAAKQSKAKPEQESFTFELPGAKKGQVVTRFPPEPSGYLHIGHAKAAMLNQVSAKQNQGRLIIRFDDTNPAKEKDEFEQSILSDLEWFGIVGDVVSHSSDFFDTIYEYAVKLINDGYAYADDTLQAQMQQERRDGIPSKSRDRPAAETLAILEQMKTGSPDALKWCLRAKLSVDDPNKAMRDPVIYRCNIENKHHRTGDKWKIYPTYDFTCPILDSIEGVSHALRANEYRDRNPQYAWFQKVLGLRPCAIWDFSRLNFNYTLLSKRHLAKIVDQGIASGWDDPRFPTIRGLRRRGLVGEALRQYIISLGASQSILQLEWDGLWAANKKCIDPIAPRFYAVDKEYAVTVTIKGGPSTIELKEQPRHKKNPDVGTKKTAYASTIILDQADAQTFKQDEEITLMDWGNAFVRKIAKGRDGIITSIEMELHLAGDFKKTEKKITWLASSSDAPKLISGTLFDFDYFITKRRLEEGEEWTSFLTPITKFKKEVWVDPNISSVPAGTHIQFERKGYFIVDAVRGEGDSLEMDYNLIPDGRSVSVGLKNGKVAGTSWYPVGSTIAPEGTTSAPAVVANQKFEPVPSMYKVKPVFEEVKLDTTGINMYAVKPVV